LGPGGPDPGIVNGDEGYPLGAPGLPRLAGGYPGVPVLGGYPCWPECVGYPVWPGFGPPGPGGYPVTLL